MMSNALIQFQRLAHNRKRIMYRSGQQRGKSMLLEQNHSGIIL